MSRHHIPPSRSDLLLSAAQARAELLRAAAGRHPSPAHRAVLEVRADLIDLQARTSRRAESHSQPPEPSNER